MELINNLSHNPVITALAWTLLHSIWQAAIIIIAALIIANFLTDSQKRYKIFISAYLLLIIGSLVTFLTLFSRDGNESNRFVEMTGAQEIIQTAISSENGGSLLEILYRNINNYSHFAVIFWMSGIFAIMLKTLLGLSVVSYAKRNGKEKIFNRLTEIIYRLEVKGFKLKSPKIVETALCKIPMVAGVIKPVILLPAGMLNNLPNSYIEAVITHELFHLIRKDNLYIFIQKVIDTLFFFNPSVLVLSGMINREREIICDELAINLPLNKQTYAKALAFFTEFSHNPGYTSAALYNGQNQLYHRIQKILGVTMKNDFTGIKLMISIIIVSAGLLMAAVPEINNFISAQDSVKKSANPDEIKELPPLAGSMLNEPEMIFEAPLAPEIAEIPPVTEILEHPPAPPAPEIADSTKRVISFEEVTGIPYKNVRIETDGNYNVLALSIGGKIIPEKDFDQYGELFKKAFKHYDEEQKRLQESMEKLGVSMAELKESMSKLEALSENMETESAEIEAESERLEAESERLEAESKELESEAKQLEAQSALLEKQAKELELKSKALEKEAKQRQKEADAHELIYKEMVSDGLIQPENHMKILLTKTDFYINDVKQPDSVREKYIKLYIKYFGEDVVKKAINMEIRK